MKTALISLSLLVCSLSVSAEHNVVNGAVNHHVTPQQAGDVSRYERRIRSGLKLFRAVLSADRDISRKATNDGKLQILLLYNTDKATARLFADELKGLGRGSAKGQVQHLSLKIKTINHQQLAQFRSKRIAGIYLTEPLTDNELAKVVTHGINKHIVVYSPFEGDVEKGVFGGLQIDTQVSPLINLDTMKASQLRLKAFFLKVAKKYED